MRARARTTPPYNNDDIMTAGACSSLQWLFFLFSHCFGEVFLAVRALQGLVYDASVAFSKRAALQTFSARVESAAAVRDGAKIVMIIRVYWGKIAEVGFIETMVFIRRVCVLI